LGFQPGKTLDLQPVRKAGGRLFFCICKTVIFDNIYLSEIKPEGIIQRKL
jgi:hypothetical protein